MTQNLNEYIHRAAANHPFLTRLVSRKREVVQPDSPERRAACASAQTSASIQPPPTVPATSPFWKKSIFAPRCCGVEPRVWATVATTTRSPRSPASLIMRYRSLCGMVDIYLSLYLELYALYFVLRLLELYLALLCLIQCDKSTSDISKYKVLSTKHQTPDF